jgi:cytochrome c-type biogenesis protein CcmH/NrfG
MMMKRCAWVKVAVVLLALAGCAARSDLPQRSDLFQLTNEAQLAYEKGEDARAEQLYMALARQTPNDPETWLRLGNLYARSHKPDAAADAYQRALAINGSDARVWYNLGVIRLRQGWMSLIQAYNFSDDRDPVNKESGGMIQFLGKMPGVADPGGAPALRPAKPEAK